MKTKFFSPILILIAAISSILVSCNNETVKSANPAKYLITDDQIASIQSIEDLNGGSLYSMNYTADYKLDQLLESSAGSVQSLVEFVAGNLLSGLEETPKTLVDGGCSAFQVKDVDGTMLYGRNYDYKMNSASILIRTQPENGYKSIGLVCGGWLEFSKGSLNDGVKDISMAVAFPYLIMDGMNEKGLAVSVLKLDSTGTQQSTGKNKIMTSIAMRLILDKTSSVQEALDLLSNYDMQSAMPDANFHFLLSDATGRTVVLEYCFNDMHVVEATYVTNYYLYPEFSYIGHGRDRYDILKSTINFKKEIMTKTECLALLELISQTESEISTSMTQWSVLYDLTNLTAKVAVLRDYDRWFEFEL